MRTLGEKAEDAAHGRASADDMWDLEVAAKRYHPDPAPLESDFVDLPDEDAVDYLRDLAERLRRVPAEYGVDDYDISRLTEIARVLAHGRPTLSPDVPDTTDKGRL